MAMSSSSSTSSSSSSFPALVSSSSSSVATLLGAGRGEGVSVLLSCRATWFSKISRLAVCTKTVYVIREILINKRIAKTTPYLETAQLALERSHRRDPGRVRRRGRGRLPLRQEDVQGVLARLAVVAKELLLRGDVFPVGAASVLRRCH